ncbi:RimK/LysX family protein [Thalassolituus sp. LLYu03]|uniref:ATP-dependent zinc protease family protein n=1 Tax=Thalassolituus sp. LLYu03 TaxID=3421656 RepID=UPI003D2CE837
MPSWASRLPILLGAISIAGCATWPDQNHRSVTLDRIRQTVDASLDAHQPPAPAECQDFTAVEDQLKRQRLQMVRLTKQLQALASASPSFATADCPPASAPASMTDGKTLVGETEWIYITPPGHHYQARIDSGAATSSLSAMNITRFERNGEKWVRFWLQHDDEAEPVEVEAPLVRHVRIRQASAEETDRRPVVALTVNLGTGLQQSTEFSLTDRSQMTYPILLGREFLRDVTLIDVGRQFVQPKFVPDMPAAPKDAKAVKKVAPQPDRKAAEGKAPEGKVPDGKEPGKEAETKAADNKDSDKKNSDKKASDKKPAEKKAAENLPADSQPADTESSATVPVNTPEIAEPPAVNRDTQ